MPAPARPALAPRRADRLGWREGTGARSEAQMAKDPLAALPTEEQGLRRDLKTSAEGNRWDAFAQARLVLADWLADRGREREALLTRAPWRKVSGKTKVQIWGMGLPGKVEWDRAPRRLLMLGETTNSTWLLHFPPESLKLQPLGFGAKPEVQFIWHWQRTHVLYYDVGAHVEGFAYLISAISEKKGR
jgi:hypothetical protein